MCYQVSFKLHQLFTRIIALLFNKVEMRMKTRQVTKVHKIIENQGFSFTRADSRIDYLYV